MMYSILICLGLSLLSAYADVQIEDEISNAVGRGAQFRFTKSGLQYLAKVEAAALQAKLKNVKVPDMHGSGHRWYMDAWGVVIHGMSIGAESFTPIANSGLKLAMSGIGVSLSGTVKAHYRWHFIKLQSTKAVDVSTSGVSFSLSTKITAVGGKPHVVVTSCSANVPSVHLHFHGGFTAKLLNLIKGLFYSKIKSAVSDQICKQATKLINERGNAALANFPTRKNIKNYAYIDYSFMQPVITANYFDLNIRGEFMDYHHPVHSHLTPPAFATSAAASKMVYIWLSDYTLNTAGEVLHNAKLLRRLVKVGDKIPAYIQPFMNTKTLKHIIPALYKKYPDRPIQLGLMTTRAPHFAMSPNKAAVDLYVRVAFQVVKKDGKMDSVFYVDLSVSATGKVMIQPSGGAGQYHVAGKINHFTFKLAVGGSSLGKISLPVSNPSIQNMVQGLVVDQANPVLERGFPLPMSNHLILKSPAIAIVQSAVRVEASMEYRF